MPSQLHESLLLLFRNQRTLATELIRVVLGVSMPDYADAQFLAADFSVMDVERAAQIAVTAFRCITDLDEERASLYFDFIANSLSEAARNALKTMDARTYEYQSDFARRYLARGKVRGIEQGRTQGELAGRAAVISRLLTLRFGPLDADVESQIRALTVTELDAMAERLLSATTLRQALGER